jgi:hypothetical protein
MNYKIWDIWTRNCLFPLQATHGRNFTYCWIWPCVILRIVEFDLVSSYVLLNLTLCHLTYCWIWPCVILRIVEFFLVSSYVLLNLTLCHLTYCWIWPCVILRIVVFDLLSSYVLLYFILFHLSYCHEYFLQYVMNISAMCHEYFCNVSWIFLQCVMCISLVIDYECEVINDHVIRQYRCPRITPSR